MSTTFEHPLYADLRQELSAFRGKWLWFVLLGIGLIVLGFFALGSVVMTTLATAVFIGTLLVVGGGVEIVGAFLSRGWSALLPNLLSGVLSIVVGLLFLRAPIGAMLALTLLLVCLLMVGGIVKSVIACSYRFPAWGWSLASGILDLSLGLLVWAEWPESALWVIGMFVGISLVCRGANWIGFGITLCKLPPAETN